MSNDLFEGEFMGVPVKADIGKRNGVFKASAMMRITTPGQYHGRVLPYEGKLDERNIKYTKQHMRSLGWQGKSSKTFVEDVMKDPREVPITVRIASYTKNDGTERKWSSVDRIGAFAPPLEKPNDAEFADMDSWFAAAGDSQAGGGSQTSDDGLPF